MIAVSLALLLQAAPPAVVAGEEPVAPYVQSSANAGATPFEGDGMWRAFHGQDGVNRIVDGFVDLNRDDPRIGDIFKGQDLVRLRRTLKEQFCYILRGGCTYTGRTMQDSHRDLGIQQADMGPMVENLQAAMRREGVSFPAQNRFLAKLAPMKRDVVVR